MLNSMKKRSLWKSIGFVAISVVLCTVVLVSSVSAGIIEPYDIYGHQLVRGIENVRCLNQVNESLYTPLYRSVNAAIADWDWHLGLLNEQYGVNWNMSALNNGQNVGTPEITVYGLTYEEIKYTYDEDVYDPNEAVGFIMFYNSTGSRVTPEVSDWYSTEIVFCVDALSTAGYINDYTMLKSLVNHEIGHTLGLDHFDTDAGVIMYPNHPYRTATVPTAGDLAGIYAIYG